MNARYISNHILSSFAAALLMLLLALGSFFALEPAVSRAVTDEFLVTQLITPEISFVATANNVAMSPSIAGITGGNSAGTTSVRVRTNNDTGYNMTIAFSSSTAMGRNGGGGVIANYSPASTTRADFAFTDEIFSQFGYTVIASTSGDLPLYFRDNASLCGIGSANTASTCWSNPSTTARQIALTAGPTNNSGATTTIAFRVNVPSTPIPAVQEGTYTATATLTAVTN